MTADSAPGGSDLDRLRELAADLGALGNGDLLAWAGPGEQDAVPDEVFAVVRDAGLFGDGDAGWGVTMPADGDALMSRMWEVAEDDAIGLLTQLAGRTRPRRHLLRRVSQAEPQDVFAELVSLTGPGASWWTNTDLTRWNPITQHDFDAIVVGAGNGLIVTVVAFEGGG
jgi:hypothetical protein